MQQHILFSCEETTWCGKDSCVAHTLQLSVIDRLNALDAGYVAHIEAVLSAQCVFQEKFRETANAA